LDANSGVAELIFGHSLAVDLAPETKLLQEDKAPSVNSLARMQPALYAGVHPSPTIDIPSKSPRRFQSLRRLPRTVRAGFGGSISRRVGSNGGLARLPSRVKSLSFRVPRRQRSTSWTHPYGAPTDGVRTSTSRAHASERSFNDAVLPLSDRRQSRLRPRSLLRPLTLLGVASSPTRQPSASTPLWVSPTNDTCAEGRAATPMHQHSFIIISNDDSAFNQTISSRWGSVSPTLYPIRRFVPSSLARMWRKTMITKPTGKNHNNDLSVQTAPSEDVQRDSAEDATCVVSEANLCASDSTVYNQSTAAVAQGQDILFPAQSIHPFQSPELRAEMSAEWVYGTRQSSWLCFDDPGDGYDTESVYSS